MIFTDVTETADVGNWLLNQAPVVTVLGIVIWWLVKKYESALNKNNSLADAVIKITLLWEERYSKETMDQREIREFMKEIREILRDVRNGK